jgi:hypothetical protein
LVVVVGVEVVIVVVVSGVGRARKFNRGDLLRLGRRNRRSGHRRWRVVVTNGELANANDIAKRGGNLLVLVLLTVLVHHWGPIRVHHARVSTVGE